METLELLKDIGRRTDGDIYLGIVGPVRVGKSTFIKRFMETIVLPRIENEDEKRRAIDELPLSGDGKTITTMEPKFIPSNAVSIEVEENFYVHIRLVDCVGFLIDNASGYLEDGKMRMVKTPWFNEEIPFNEASKIGTEKVIKDHSTIGIVVLSDGIINDFKREDYYQAETKVIEEMKSLNKPFVIVLNSKTPNSDTSKKIKEELEKESGVPVILCDVLNINKDIADEILKEALYEFPINGIDLTMPNWLNALSEDHVIKKSLQESISSVMKEITNLRDVEKITSLIEENEYISKATLSSLDTGLGVITIQVDVKDGLYESVLEELVGCEITDKASLITLLCKYKEIKKDYELVGNALKMASMSGYGFASASKEDIIIDKPVVVKSGNKYGIKVKASSPSYHIIKVDVDTSFEPILGSKEQAEYFVNTLLENYDKDPLSILECVMFGRKFGDILSQGIMLKLDNLSEPVKIKLQQIIKTLSNKGKGNLIAFVF